MTLTPSSHTPATLPAVPQPSWHQVDPSHPAPAHDATEEQARIGLTIRDAERIARALEAGIAESTRSSYGYTWNVWQRWCDRRGLTALPAAPEAVAAFLAERGEAGICYGTLSMACNAIGHRHREAGLPDPMADPTLRRVRRGLRRMLGTAPKRRPHAFTTDQIRTLVTSLDPSTPAGARDRAFILLGYASAMRPSELAALLESDITETPQGLILTIRRSKGDQDARGQHVGIAPGHHPETDPISALNHWRRLRNRSLKRGLEPYAGPVFTRLLRNGLPMDLPLVGMGMTRILQQRCAALDELEHLPISGYSLRAGHATTAALNGATLERIALQTRHIQLDTLRLHYIRPIEALVRTTSRDLGL